MVSADGKFIQLALYLRPRTPSFIERSLQVAGVAGVELSIIHILKNLGGWHIEKELPNYMAKTTSAGPHNGPH
jgi:hypothetical protein